jgi:hypothetical protein
VEQVIEIIEQDLGKVIVPENVAPAVIDWLMELVFLVITICLA